MKSARQSAPAPTPGLPVRPGASHPAESCGLGLRRNGNAVTITITCADDYAAIALYEQVVAGSKRGDVSLKIRSAG